MDYLSAVSELNYMTQIVIMLYEDNNKVMFLLVCLSIAIMSQHCIFLVSPICREYICICFKNINKN